MISLADPGAAAAAAARPDETRRHAPARKVKESPVKKLPKYLEIEQYFSKKIESGELEYGDRIPTEQELCDAFGVSRMTINKALTQLADKGYIKRGRGLGSFVINRNLVKKVGRGPKSMTQDIVNSGMKPGSKLLSYQVIRGSENPFIARKLGLGADDYMHYFVRLRTGDDQPIAISYTYISFRLLPEISVAALEGSFNEYLTRRGIVRSHLRSEFAATLPTPEQREILGYDNFALLKQNLLWYVGEVPFEFTSHCFLGNRFSLSRDLDLVVDSDLYEEYLEGDDGRPKLTKVEAEAAPGPAEPKKDTAPAT